MRSQRQRYTGYMIAASTLTFCPAIAQDFTPALVTNAPFWSTSTLVIADDVSEKLRRTDSDRTIARKMPVTQNSNEVLLTFSPSANQRKKNIADFIARVRTMSPENANAFQAQLNGTDIFQSMASSLRPLGLSTNNIADAYTVYWISIWEASHGLVRPNNPIEVKAVKAQVEKIMRSAPEFVSLTSVEKQALTEDMYLTSMVIGSSLDLIKDDPKLLAFYATQINNQAKSQGFPLDTMTLTENGFVPATNKRAKR